MVIVTKLKQMAAAKFSSHGAWGRPLKEPGTTCAINLRVKQVHQRPDQSRQHRDTDGSNNIIAANRAGKQHLVRHQPGSQARKIVFPGNKWQCWDSCSDLMDASVPYGYVRFTRASIASIASYDDVLATLTAGH
jgi:hypothetical protein